MDKVVLVKVNVRSYLRDGKLNAAQTKINEYIRDNSLDVICVSLFKEDENEYIFTLTLR